MKVLADATFPKSITLPNAARVEIVRYTGGAIPDDQLIELAASEGYLGVLLLGREVLANATLEATTAAHGLSLIVTVSEHPVEAEAQLRARIEDLPARLGREHLIVMGKNGAVERAPHTTTTRGRTP